MCRISAIVDIPNNCIVNAKVAGFESGERVLAIEQIKELGVVPNALFLFDRGYWSPELLAAILANEQKFLIRLQSNHAKSVAKDKKLKALGLRFVSFKLGSGDAENLLTNLPVHEVSDEELFELYAKRWGIESKYLELKSRLEIDNLSEKSLNSVLQDIYATLYMSNLTAFLCYEADEIIQEKTAGRITDTNRKPTVPSVFRFSETDSSVFACSGTPCSAFSSSIGLSKTSATTWPISENLNCDRAINVK
jgi:hypothetical protein